MKRMTFIVFIFVIITAFCSSSFSQPASSNQVKISPGSAKYSIIEANYLDGLKSENKGLKVSCAYYLGEIKSKKAVVPLMAMLRNENDKGAKLIAAWSLLKIGDSRGVYLVSNISNDIDCTAVLSMLEHLYINYTEFNKHRAIAEIK